MPSARGDAVFVQHHISHHLSASHCIARALHTYYTLLYTEALVYAPEALGRHLELCFLRGGRRRQRLVAVAVVVVVTVLPRPGACELVPAISLARHWRATAALLALLYHHHHRPVIHDRRRPTQRRRRRARARAQHQRAIDTAPLPPLPLPTTTTVTTIRHAHTTLALSSNRLIATLVCLRVIRSSSRSQRHPPPDFSLIRLISLHFPL